MQLRGAYHEKKCEGSYLKDVKINIPYVAQFKIAKAAFPKYCAVGGEVTTTWKELLLSVKKSVLSLFFLASPDFGIHDGVERGDYPRKWHDRMCVN